MTKPSPELGVCFRDQQSPGGAVGRSANGSQNLDDVTDEEFQKRPADAKALIAATEDHVDREILTMAYAAMVRRLMGRPSGELEFVFEPVELLDTLKMMLRHKEVIAGLISGKYLTLEEACDDLGIF